MCPPKSLTCCRHKWIHGNRESSEGKVQLVTSWGCTCPPAPPAQASNRVQDPWKSLLIDKCWLALHVKLKVLFTAVGLEFNYPWGKCSNHKTINNRAVLDNIFVLDSKSDMYRMMNEGSISASFVLTVNEGAGWNVWHAATGFCCIKKKKAVYQISNKSKNRIP